MTAGESESASRHPDSHALGFTIGIAVVLIGGAFVLYRPALRIGLLSDDYALLLWARRLELAPPDWGQIRPLPILAWWAIADITSTGRTPAVLHALNVALHGCNALLVFLFARRLTDSRLTALAAGAVFLVLPTSVEPVAWASGIFDVMLATFALLLGVVVTARQELRPIDAAVCVLLTIGMMAAKETGVIAGPLALLLYWVRWSRLSRRVILLGLTQLVLAGSYALGRELTGRLDHRLVPHPDIMALSRLVSGTTRFFFMPLHGDFVRDHPLIAVATGAAIMAIVVAWVFRWRTRSNAMRIGVLAALGTLVCIAPAIRLFGITPDLQGTRYVYLAGAWWSIALAAALLDGWDTRSLRVATTAIAVLGVVSAASVTRRHLEPWTTARAVRDRVLQRLIAMPPTCLQAAAAGVPDNVAGAYVFRNGLNEALMTLGRSYEWVETERAAPECRADLN